MHVLIAGGSRGIGLACTKLFASKGDNISVIYNNTPIESSSNITAFKCDVSDPDQVKDTVRKITETNGSIDSLVYSSGIALTGLVTDFSAENYRKITDTNYGGLFFITHEVIPQMVRNQKGTITAISSMWGQTGSSCESLYAASKGAVDAYIKSLAKELGPSNIRVNAVSPGVVDTDMMKEYSDEDKEALKDETPLGRIGTPSEIAHVVYYLSTESSSFITGQIIGVNGGFLI